MIPEFIARLKVLDDACATGVVWSVTVTVNVAAAKTRSASRELTCAGREAQARRQRAAAQREADVPNPPLAVTGVNGAAATFTVRVVEAIACVVISVTGLTVRLKVLDDVCATGVAWSVAVTVNVLQRTMRSASP